MTTIAQSDYDCFGWNSVRGLPAAETYGLDFESAREATPRLYGVSSGDGNNGVSHMFANYYVRTNDPWRLARLALISDITAEWQERAKDAIEIDGEADYTISATIYDPLDEEETFCNRYECPNEECDQIEWAIEGATLDYQPADCPTCGVSCEPVDSEEQESWSSANGAWLIWEVFSDDEPRDGAPIWDSIQECFTESDLALVPAE